MNLTFKVENEGQRVKLLEMGNFEPEKSYPVVHTTRGTYPEDETFWLVDEDDRIIPLRWNRIQSVARYYHRNRGGRPPKKDE